MNDDPKLSAAAYRELIADFLAAHAFKHQGGGYPAFEGELIAGGDAIRADRKINVFVSAVICEYPDTAGVEPVPSLWFLVDRDHRALDSFAVATELVIEALENLDFDASEIQIPVPAVEACDPHENSVVAGKESLYLKISPTRIESAVGSAEPRLPASGVRFELGETDGDSQKPPIHRFAMAGVTPFVALSAAFHADFGSGPKTFAQEVEELAQEIEESKEAPQK